MSKWLNGLNYIGVWNASKGLPVGKHQQGDFYICEEEGNGYKVGEYLVCDWVVVEK